MKIEYSRPISIYEPLGKIFSFLKDSKDKDIMFGEYLLEKISEMIEAVAIKTEEYWFGLCKNCGAIDLNNHEVLRYEFFIQHDNLCWLADKKTNIEIDFLRCLQEDNNE